MREVISGVRCKQSLNKIVKDSRPSTHRTQQVMHPAPRFSLGSLLIFLVACGDSAAVGGGASGGSDTGGSGGNADGGHAMGGGDPNILVGAFQVALKKPTDEAGFTSIAGRLFDGPSPANIGWEPGSEVDGCQLFEPRVPFCSPSCGGSAVCVEDDTCQDYPAAHSAGVVSVTGIRTEAGENTFEMSPIAENYQAPAGTTLAYPPFDEGDVVTLSAAGDYFAAFEIEARGIAPLSLSTDDAIALDESAGAVLAWSAPADATTSVHVKLDISHHGGSKGKIECDVPDTGAVTIAPSLISELLGLGVSGYPTVVVSRENIGSAIIESGRVDLVISSSVERAVAIEGLTSCTGDADCPDGQTCQVDLKCG